MTKLTSGFKLFQPWATDVVRGKLNFLVRSMITKKREKVAVIATRGLDGIWFEKANSKKIIEVFSKVGVIGSVEIKDCIEVELNKVKDELIKHTGTGYWDYYPKYLIPDKTHNGMVYIWFLKNAKEWKHPKQIEGRSMTWVKIEIEDE